MRVLIVFFVFLATYFEKKFFDINIKSYLKLFIIILIFLFFDIFLF